MVRGSSRFAVTKKMTTRSQEASAQANALIKQHIIFSQLSDDGLPAASTRDQ